MAPRRFAPVPVETSTKSSKHSPQHEEQAKKAPRKFAVEPVETSTKEGRKADVQGEKKPKSRFAPQPVEMSTKSRRRQASPPADDTQPPSTASADAAQPKLQERPKRTFAPQLIDTATRSRKASDNAVTIHHHHKTDVTPSHVLKTQTTSLADPHEDEPRTNRPLLLPHELRRERSTSSGSVTRSHSFRAPDLETIESSESEPSNSPSLSTSPSTGTESPLTSSDIPLSQTYKHATRIRESIDESFSKYMLELEARRAEQKMHEQALAAFPNSDYHEPVAHYVDEDESDEMQIDDRPATWDGHEDEDEDLPKRKGTVKVNWELQEMQRHHEQLEKDRVSSTRAATRRVETNPWWNPAVQDFAAAPQDSEFSQMRDSARPPMLGSDITFPRSASPIPARFDVTQGSHVLRSQMCYLTEQSEAQSSVNTKTADGLWGKASAQSSRATSQGLWGGFCVETAGSTSPGLAPPSMPTGLMTPAALEPANPFDQAMYGSAISVSRPPTPPNTASKMGASTSNVSRIDSVLNSDRELDELMARDYPDTFITQVYNYLSLGYPSLARPFDEELSKIAQVPMKDLRHDDQIAKDMPKGYIRLGDDFEGRGDGSDQTLNAVANGGCARWYALRKYVREWARQEKGMVPVDALGGNWGTGARRGSWAW